VTPLLTLSVGLLLAPVVASLLASVLSCLSILRDRKPPWSLALLSLVLGMIGSLWFIFGRDILYPANWPGSIPEHWVLFVVGVVLATGITSVAVLVAVALFRLRFKKHLSWDKRRFLHHERRRTSWRRLRWFHLSMSSMLMIILTGCLMWSYATWISIEDHPDDSTAEAWSRRASAAPESRPRPAHEKPEFNLTSVVVSLWPFCALGLAGSGAWLAYTVAYWPGYMKVAPRHRRDLLIRHHPTAAGH
jgi:hypothetical protein